MILIVAAGLRLCLLLRAADSKHSASTGRAFFVFFGCLFCLLCQGKFDHHRRRGEKRYLLDQHADEGKRNAAASGALFHLWSVNNTAAGANCDKN